MSERSRRVTGSGGKAVKAIRESKFAPKLTDDDWLKLDNYSDDWAKEARIQAPTTKNKQKARLQLIKANQFNIQNLKPGETADLAEISPVTGNPHSALAIKHDGIVYIFDSNDDQDTDEDYPFFREQDYPGTVRPMLVRQRCLHSDLPEEGTGMCFLWTQMVKQIYLDAMNKGYGWDYFIDFLNSNTPSQVVHKYQNIIKT